MRVDECAYAELVGLVLLDAAARVGAAIWTKVKRPIQSGWSSNIRATARNRSSSPFV